MSPTTPHTRKETVDAVEYRYTAIFEPTEEGGYTVTVPALTGLVTEGRTLAEAREMVKEAILGYIESLQKHGEEIPTEEPNTITERVPITLARA